MTDKLTDEELDTIGHIFDHAENGGYHRLLKRLLDEHAELKASEDELLKKMRALCSQLDDDRSKLAAVEKEFAELKAKLSADDRCGASRQELLAQISGLRADWDTLKEMLDAARHAKKVAEMQRDEFAAASTELRAKIIAAEKERDELRRRIRDASSAMATHPRDWAADHRDAWLWGIIVGWDEPALRELSEKFKWSEKTLDKLQECTDAETDGNPSLDGTPNAHPAFWRGTKAATQAIERFRSNFLDSSTENAVCRDIAQMLRELTTKKNGE